MHVERLPLGPLAQNCYVVHEPAGEALVIDPGGGAETIVAYVRSHHLRVRAILNTHGHFDHIGAVDEVREAVEAPFLIHEREIPVLKAAATYHVVFLRRSGFRAPQADGYLKEGVALMLGGVPVSVIETPGHSPGSVSFVIQGALFTGDTLLPGRIGRVDLPGGDARLLRESLRRLARHPATAPVFPGHGPQSTLGAELGSNEPLLEALGCAPAHGD